MQYWESAEWERAVINGATAYVSPWKADGSREVVIPLPTKEVALVRNPMSWLMALTTPGDRILGHIGEFSPNHRKAVSVELEKNDGISLSFYEERVVDAALAAFTRSGFKPVFLKPSELCDLAGLVMKTDPSGQALYDRQERTRLIYALEQELARRDFPLIWRDFTTGRVITGYEHILEVRTVYKSEGDYQSSRREGWWITPGVVLAAQSATFFRLLPSPGDLIAEVRTYLHGRKTGLSTHRLYGFIKWLHRHSSDTVEVRRNWRVLAGELKLSYMVRRREDKKLQRLLHRLYAAAKSMGYLTSYRIGERSKKNDKTVDVLILNPARFAHIKVRRAA